MPKYRVRIDADVEVEADCELEAETTAAFDCSPDFCTAELVDGEEEDSDA